jgi:hypothetical protein
MNVLSGCVLYLVLTDLAATVDHTVLAQVSSLARGLATGPPLHWTKEVPAGIGCCALQAVS